MNLANPANRNGRVVLFCVAFGLLIFTLLCLRRPDALTNAQFWAEDGGVFFKDQTVFGFWGSLFRLYSGYVHFIPRIVAGALCALPVRWVPLGFNISALLIEAVCCSAFVWPCFRTVIASDTLRAACCLAATCSTLAGSELIGTLSNVQWFLCILSLLLLFVQVQSVWGEACLALLQVAIALTAPVTLLFVPILAWQLRRKTLRPALHLLALLAQFLIMRHAMAGPKPVLRFSSLFTATLASAISRCVLTPILGSGFLTSDSEVTLFTKFSVVLILGTILITLLVLRSRNHWPLVTATYFGSGSLLAIMWGRAVVNQFQGMEGFRHYTAERYFFIGACMFIFILALSIEKWRFPAPILLLVFSAGTVQNFSARTFADLHWQQSAPQIEAWKAKHAQHLHPAPLLVPINPPGLQLVLEEN